MIALLLTAAFVLLNGFFVAAEFALVKLRATQLERLALRPDDAARSVVRIGNQLEKYLSATQMGITLASLGLGWIGEKALTHTLETFAHRLGFPVTAAVHSVAFVLGFSLLTAAHIIFGELVPKLLAIGAAEKVALSVARPLQVFYWITWPGLMVINAGASLMIRLLGMPDLKHAEGALSETEILGLLTQSYAKGRLSQPKRQLLERVIRFTERSVKTAMVPRVDVTFLEADVSLEEALLRARKSGYTRYPVVEDADLDRLVGYVNLKDLLMSPQAPRTLRSAMREALCLPETLGLFEAMQRMQETQSPFAVVVDEYGGTSGIITLEDVLEEIVGEIRDEHDEEGVRVEVRGDGGAVVDGLTPLDALRAVGIDLGPVEADTVGGAILDALGRVANSGDKVSVGGYTLRVESLRRRRVARVTIRKRPVSDPPRPSGH